MVHNIILVHMVHILVYMVHILVHMVHIVHDAYGLQGTYNTVNTKLLICHNLFSKN